MNNKPIVPNMAIFRLDDLLFSVDIVEDTVQEQIFEFESDYEFEENNILLVHYDEETEISTEIIRFIIKKDDGPSTAKSCLDDEELKKMIQNIYDEFNTPDVVT
jgi:hypothetical protein